MSTPTREVLDARIPPEAIATRIEAKRTVSYLHGWYVIHRLNHLFGFDGWSHSLLSCDVVSVETDQENRNWIGYRAVVRLTVGDTVHDGVGFGEGIDRSAARAHESAGKEAATDALKRAAIHLGLSFGLALYDKTGKANALAPEPPPPSPLAEARRKLGLSPEDCHAWVNAWHAANPNASQKAASDAVRDAIVLAAQTGETLESLLEVTLLPKEGKGG